MILFHILGVSFVAKYILVNARRREIRMVSNESLLTALLFATMIHKLTHCIFMNINDLS